MLRDISRSIHRDSWTMLLGISVQVLIWIDVQVLDLDILKITMGILA